MDKKTNSSSTTPLTNSSSSPNILSQEDEFSETNSSSSLNSDSNSQPPVIININNISNSNSNNINSNNNNNQRNSPTLPSFPTHPVIIPSNNKLNSIVNSKSASSGNLSGSGSGIGAYLADDKISKEDKIATVLDDILKSIKSGNTTFLSNAFKTKSLIPLNYQLPNKNTFLHNACEHMKMTSLNLILEKTKTQLVNLQNDKSKTPLFIACENGFYKGAIVLLDYGSSPLITNANGWNSIHKICSDEFKKDNIDATKEFLIGHNPEIQMELIEKIFKFTSKPQHVVALKTNKYSTPLHLSITAHNWTVSQFLAKLSTVESFLIKDSNGNTPLHCLAYKLSSKSLALVEQVLKFMSDNQNGEDLRNYIDEPNNLMASSLQVSMKNNNQKVTRVLVKYRFRAEQKILEKFFEDLQKQMSAPSNSNSNGNNNSSNNDSMKLQIENISYLDQQFQSTQFGQLFKRIVVIIKQHYVINMSHQNANILLVRAKDTIKRFFEWMEENISDQDYVRFYKEMLLTQVYDTIIHLYKETNKSKDLFFQQRVGYFKKIDHGELDITEHSWDQNVDLFPKALEIMNSLQKKRTPSEKINTLNEATSQISRTDANDLTPMFMFLLIRSEIEHIQSEFQFMDDFKETPEQEQYLVLLQGSLDYLETLNFTLRNSNNQVMSLSGIVERTIDNILSLIDEFQHQSKSTSEEDKVEDIDEGIRIFDEITLLSMLLSKLSNRITDHPIFLPLKWSDSILKTYHFKAIIERLGLKIDLDESVLLKTPLESQSPIINSNNNNDNNNEPQQNNKIDLINNPGYVCQKKGAICIILEHPYPQMVYQVIESEIRKEILPKLLK